MRVQNQKIKHRNLRRRLQHLEAQSSVEINVEALRDLVHNLADANCNGLEITSDMSRAEIKDRLELYRYPLSILQPEEGSSLKYNAALLQKYNEEWQKNEEESMRVQTVKMNNAGEMVFVEADGKLVGMIGIRKLGSVKWKDGKDRQLYECPRFSILPGYDETIILQKLIKKVQASILKECQNPLILVHTKRPSVRKWATRRDNRSITCEDYANRRNFHPNELAEVKERWEKEGWEYFEVDPLKKSSKKD